MHSIDDIAAQQRATQERIFRLAQRDHGLTLKAISLDSQIPYPTLQTYARGDAMMSVAALRRLIGVIPDYLLSLLLPPGHVIVQVPEDVDHDAIAERMQEFLRAKQAAHHPDSEDGREIGPNEDNVLRMKAAEVKAA